MLDVKEHGLSGSVIEGENEKTFSAPLPMYVHNLADILEKVRWAPFAVNMQSWRVVKDGDKFHFYEKHTKYYDAETYGDVQKIDTEKKLITRHV